MKNHYSFNRYVDASRLFHAKTDQAIPLLQAETAKMLGLGSSDEITVTNVNGAQPDALGGQKLSYRATTEKGVFSIAHR